MSARLFALFGAVAFGLACISLYGTLSFVVSQRIAEIGVRMALGARPSDVMRLVMRQGVRPLILGTLLGLAPCVVAVQVLQIELATPGLLAPRDALVLPLVVGVQAVVASLACWIPARQATRLDPIASLRRV
jgi:ABC-type antimicrobial peptide transport system permease subunit